MRKRTLAALAVIGILFFQPHLADAGDYNQEQILKELVYLYKKD
jgi:hypothetical protein